MQRANGELDYIWPHLILIVYYSFPLFFPMQSVNTYEIMTILKIHSASHVNLWQISAPRNCPLQFFTSFWQLIEKTCKLNKFGWHPSSRHWWTFEKHEFLTAIIILRSVAGVLYSHMSISLVKLELSSAMMVKKVTPIHLWKLPSETSGKQIRISNHCQETNVSPIITGL